MVLEKTSTHTEIKFFGKAPCAGIISSTTTPTSGSSKDGDNFAQRHAHCDAYGWRSGHFAPGRPHAFRSATTVADVYAALGGAGVRLLGADGSSKKFRQSGHADRNGNPSKSAVGPLVCVFKPLSGSDESFILGQDRLLSLLQAP